MNSIAEVKSGYLKRSTLVRLVTAAGLRLADDWPGGVWTLPLTLKLGDTNRARYLAIGESDRIALKFVKLRCAEENL